MFCNVTTLKSVTEVVSFVISRIYTLALSSLKVKTYLVCFRNYIKRLLKQELRQADEEIDDLTTKLQHNIDEKQKHVSDA